MVELKISISEEIPSNITIVNIGGILDASSVPDIEKVMNSIIDGNSCGVILNLSSVDYISTAGWSALIIASAKIAEKAGENENCKKRREIVLTNMIPNVSENYYLLDFDKIIKSFEAVKDAAIYFDDIDK